MNEFAIIDVETSLLTDGEIPKTKFWGFYDGKEYLRFNTTKELSRYMRRREALTVLHHANFDVIQLLVDGEKLSITSSHNGRLITSRWHDHTLLNSFSTFPLSLKSLMQAFGYEKTSLEQLAKRNYDDCVVGLECFLKMDSLFKDLVGISPLARHTIAGTGFAAAEKTAGKMPKNLKHLSAYRGARTEVFNLNKRTLSAFDINSSYPASIIDAPEKSHLLHVRVKTNDWHAPLFNVDCTEMLLFPNGTFESWVYEDVFERYIEPFAEKTSVKILQAFKIDLSWLNKLRQLVFTIYQKKNSSKGAIRLACKLLLNSLYGRIGLNGVSERARVLPYCVDGDGLCYYLGKKRWLVFDEVEREPRSNFPLAAYITDNARGRLFAAIKQNCPYYVDTDSLFVEQGSKRFVGSIGQGIGEWNFKGREVFQAKNVKDYEFGSEVVLKGGKQFLVWTLKKFARGESVTSVQRTRRTPLRKRQVLPSGETLPLHV